MYLLCGKFEFNFVKLEESIAHYKQNWFATFVQICHKNVFY